MVEDALQRHLTEGANASAVPTHGWQEKLMFILLSSCGWSIRHSALSDSQWRAYMRDLGLQAPPEVVTPFVQQQGSTLLQQHMAAGNQV